MRHKYTLFRRKGKKIWYFQYYEGHERVARSTGKIKKFEAEQYVESFLSLGAQKPVIFGEFAQGFFELIGM